jgi:uncharacterized membrane protein
MSSRFNPLSLLPLAALPLADFSYAFGWSGKGIGLLLAAAGALGYFSARKKRSPGGDTAGTTVLRFLPLTLMGTGILLVLRIKSPFLYYPACMSALAASAFLLSVIFPPSIVERIAVVIEPEIPSAGLRYCRKVSIVWAAFLFFNALLSLATIYSQNLKLWAYYNGAVSYILMALLFGAELLVRKKVKRALGRA